MIICAIRIDERLIHGQVATLWQGSWGCNRIMVIDEASSKDPLLKSVLKISCPSGVKLSVLTPEKAAENLKSDKYGSERITIVTKRPQVIVDLINYGLEISTPVTIGNMSNDKTKTKIAKNIGVTKDDVESFRKLNKLGIKLVSQMVPSEVPASFMPILELGIKEA
jgi:PTS system mannose-specific IIB component